MVRITFFSLKKTACYALLLVGVLGMFCESAYAQNFTSHQSASHLGSECYRLTPKAMRKTGYIWHKDRINLLTPFDITVSAYFGDTDALGADGIAFVLQRDPDGTAVAGSYGGQLGLNSIAPSLAVEFDTWDNLAGDGYPDIAADHIDVLKDGNVHSSILTSAVALPYNIENDSCHLIRITWDPVTTRFRVFFDNMSTPKLDIYYNMIGNVFDGDPSDIIWGFSSATGDKVNEHRISPLITKIAPREIAVCQGAQTLNVEGSGNFTWTPGPGMSGTLSCTTCANPVATPTTTGYYLVTANVGCADTTLGKCSYTDTVFVGDSCCASCDDFLNDLHPPASFELVYGIDPDSDTSCCYQFNLYNPHLTAPPKFLCSYYGVRVYPVNDTDNLIIDYFDDEVDLYPMYGAYASNFDHSVVQFCLGRSAFTNGALTLRFEFLDKNGNVICDELTQTIQSCLSGLCDCDQLFNFAGAKDETIVEVSEFEFEEGQCCFRLDPYIDWDYFGCDFYGWRVYDVNSPSTSYMSYFNGDTTVSDFGQGSFDLSQTAFCIPESEFSGGSVDIKVEYLDENGDVICKAHAQSLKCNYCDCDDLLANPNITVSFEPSSATDQGSCCWELTITNNDSCNLPIPTIAMGYAGGSSDKIHVFNIDNGSGWGSTTTPDSMLALFNANNGSSILPAGKSLKVATICVDRGNIGNYVLPTAFFDMNGDDSVDCQLVPSPIELACESSLCCDTLCDDVIQNGDFEDTSGVTGPASPIGFTTDYEFRDSSFNSSGDVAVVDDASKSNGAFVGTGNGKFLVVDGSTTPNQSFWKQTVTVQPFTDYCITFWVKNVVNNPNKPKIQFRINGMPLDVGFAGDTLPDTNFVSPGFTDGWVKVCAKWNSGPLTSVALDMLNLSTVFAGNDFAIDDIVFGKDCGTYKKAFANSILDPTEHGFELIGNRPNPFNGRTTIEYVLPEKASVEITVYSVDGRKMTTVGTSEQLAGVQSIELNASGWPLGVYFYHIRVHTSSGQYHAISKMVIARP